MLYRNGVEQILLMENRLISCLLVICCILKTLSASAITCDTKFQDEQDNTDYVCPNQKCPSDNVVYGTYHYTSDSKVCRAAWHDGRILPWSDNDADRTVRWTTCESPSVYLQSFRYGAGRTWGFGGIHPCKNFVSNRKNESLYRLGTLSSVGSQLVRVYGESNVDLTTDVISASVYDTTTSTSSPPTEVFPGNTVGYKEYCVHTGVNVFTTAGNKSNLYSKIVNINYGKIPVLRADQSTTLRLVSSSFNMAADAGKAIDGNPSTDFMNGQSCSHTLKRSNLQNPWWRVEFDGMYSVYGINVTSRGGSHDCKNTQLGKDYMGTVSEARNGKTCKMWRDTSKPSNPENYCRNPDNEPNGPWCYPTSGGWVYCDVSLCSGLTESLRDFQVRVSNTSDTPSAISTDVQCKHYTGTVSDATTVYIACDRPVTGRYLYIIKNGNSKSETLSLCEVEVWGKPVNAGFSTLTTRVSVGDRATLTFEGIESSGIQWQKDSAAFYESGDIDGWNDKLTNTIDSVEVGHGGVYTIYRSHGNVLGITRLVVRVCPRGNYGVDCTEDCPQCENGGICHDITGECICPPGFSGHNCSTGCGGNRFGSDCLSHCSELDREDGCRGKYMCTIDPYGCSCLTGFKGMTCSEECREGYYGADCQQACGHCINNVICNPYTGRCPYACAPGYMTFPYCQTEIARLKDAPVVVSRTRVILSVGWLGWRSETDPGMGPVEKYVVEYKQVGGAVWTHEEVSNVSNQPTYFTYNISNTDVSHAYLVRIRIKVTGGLAGNSSPEVEVCGEPETSEPSLSNTDVNTIDINWPETGWRCGTRGWYVVEYINKTDTAWERTSNITSNDTSLYTASCTTWRVRVRTFNKHMSTVSPEESITSQNKAPSQVQDLDIETGSANSTSLTVVWKEPESNGCPIEEYRLTYELVKVLQCTVGHSGDEVTEILHTTRKGITGLKPNSKYEIKVAAKTKYLGEESLLNGSTLEYAPSGKVSVTNLTKSTRSVSITVSELNCQDRNGVISHHEYMITNDRTTCSSASVNKSGTFTELQTDVTGLLPGISFTVRIRAHTVAGAGPWSDDERFTTLEEAPTSPKNLSVIDMSSTFVIIEWMPPCPANGVIREYQLKYQSLNATDDSNITTCTDCSSLTLLNLKINNAYEFKVRAKTTDWGNWSRSIYETVKEGVPEMPESVLCKDRTPNSLTVHWVEPSRKNGFLTQYKLSWNAAHEKPLPVPVKPTIRKFTVPDLNPGTRYTVQVAARTSVGFGPPATVICWTGLSDLPKLQISKIDTDEMTSTTVALPIVPVTDYPNSNDIKFYLIVVEREKIISRRRREAIEVSTLKGYEEATSSGDSRYITGNLTHTEVETRKTFVVGDQKTYGGYKNVQLKAGGRYRFLIGVYVQNDFENKTQFQVLEFEGLASSEFIEAKNFKQDRMTTIGGACGGVAAFLLVLALVVFIVRRRRQQAENKSTSSDLRLDDIKTDESTNGFEHAYVNAEPMNGSPQPCNPLLSEPVYEDFNKSIKVEDLVWYVGNAFNNDIVVKEYESLPIDHIFPHNEGIKEENKKKNRFKNILAYDKNRIVLELLPHDINSGYVNATYIDAYNRPKAFIAAMGPNRNTVEDFWRMIWQEQITRIVMLTKNVEDGKRKCEVYWPERTQVEKYGDVTVTAVDKEKGTDFTIRKFEVSKVNCEQQTLKTTQYHFTSWPDHGVPSSSSALWKFYQAVKDHIREDNDGVPTVVHCSAGVGRTGTFIMMDILSDQADAEGAVDVLGQLGQLRQQRVNMVQTLDQYKFIYTAMVEKLHTGDTFIPTAEFQSRLQEIMSNKTTLKKEFKTLNQLCLAADAEEYAAGKTKENSSKNRDPNILPLGRSRPYLMTAADDGGNDYINAVFVNGYNQRDAFIVTQSPLPNTVGDFWRMVHDHDCHVIVMLSDANQNDDTCPQYWPDEESVRFGRYEVECVGSRYHHGDVIKQRTLVLTDTRKPNSKGREITHFQVRGWPNKLAVPPSNLQSALIELIEIVELAQQQTGKNAAVIHCLDGCTRSGYFCTLANLFEKIKVEQGVDVFQTVKNIRVTRFQFITNVDQYRSLYSMAEQFIQSFDTYANFS